ncbi:MAG: RNA polymerase sigma factor [Planctomycetota bacterium]
MAMLEPEEARRWFDSAVEENYRMMYGIAYNILRNAQSAEDATQEAVLRAFSQLNSLDNPQAVTGWLVRIVQNVARDMRKKHTPVLASNMVDGEKMLEPIVATRDVERSEAEEERNQLRTAVSKLSPEQSAVVTMRYMEDLDVIQIAERLGKNPNAVAALLHRARTSLKKLMVRKTKIRIVRKGPVARVN